VTRGDEAEDMVRAPAEARQPSCPPFLLSRARPVGHLGMCESAVGIPVMSLPGLARSEDDASSVPVKHVKALRQRVSPSLFPRKRSLPFEGVFAGGF